MFLRSIIAGFLHSERLISPAHQDCSPRTPGATAHSSLCDSLIHSLGRSFLEAGNAARRAAAMDSTLGLGSSSRAGTARGSGEPGPGEHGTGPAAALLPLVFTLAQRRRSTRYGRVDPNFLDFLIYSYSGLLLLVSNCNNRSNYLDTSF